MTNCFILAKHRLVYMVSITSGEPVVCVWAKSASLENKDTVNCLQVTSAWIAYRVNEMRFNLFFFFLFFFLFDKTSIIFNSKYKHSIKTGRFYTSCILFITQKFKGVLNKRNKSCWNLCEGGNSPGSLPWHLALNQQQRRVSLDANCVSWWNSNRVNVPKKEVQTDVIALKTKWLRSSGSLDFCREKLRHG